jgi:acetyl-CoA synthetase
MDKKNTLLYHRFMEETLDEDGNLKDVAYHIPENFNFGFDVVDALAQKSPDKTAMLWESNSHEVKRFSFSDMMRLSNQTANYLCSLGIKKGDRVLLILKRHYQFWYTIVALHKIGAVAIPATYLLKEEDLVYRFDAAKIGAVICTADGDVADNVDLALKHDNNVSLKLIVNGKKDGWLDFDCQIEAQSDQFERPAGALENKACDPMLMYFTSGTTAYPKIAVQDYTYPIGHIITARWWHNVNPNGLHFTISDTGWGKAVWGKIYGQWLCEAPIYTYDFDRFNADDILKLFAKHQITTFCAPPTMYRMFIKESLEKYDLSSLTYACTAGEALNPEVYYQFEKATGMPVMEGFGQTETTLTLGNLIGMTPKPGSMGKPTPQYDIALISGNGTPAGIGEVGEICIRTESGKPCGMFSGYYLDEQQTSEAWHDGLYHTGDMARLDEDGYYWYVGRTDDIIKSSGYRISPFEVENVIMEIPYVLECAITGVPDEIRGQLVKATIVLTKDKQASEDLKKEVQQYVKTHTAPYKYPRVVEFAEELPKTVSGKIRRVEIREQDQQ